MISPPIQKKSSTVFRWCEKREQRVSLAICHEQAKKVGRCKKCLAVYMQLPLPFPTE